MIKKKKSDMLFVDRKKIELSSILLFVFSPLILFFSILLILNKSNIGIVLLLFDILLSPAIVIMFIMSSSRYVVLDDKFIFYYFGKEKILYFSDISFIVEEKKHNLGFMDPNYTINLKSDNLPFFLKKIKGKDFPKDKLVDKIFFYTINKFET